MNERRRGRRPRERKLPDKKFMRLETASEVYDMKPRTLRQMCLTDKRLSLQGRPGEAPFRGKAVKVSRLWHIPIAELERIFKEGEDVTGAKRGVGKKRAGV